MKFDFIIIEDINKDKYVLLKLKQKYSDTGSKLGLDFMFLDYCLNLRNDKVLRDLWWDAGHNNSPFLYLHYLETLVSSFEDSCENEYCMWETGNFVLREIFDNKNIYKILVEDSIKIEFTQENLFENAFKTIRGKYEKNFKF